MLRSGITGVALFRAELALARDAALELRLYFLRTSLFKRVRATDRERGECNRDEDREGSHPLTL